MSNPNIERMRQVCNDIVSNIVSIENQLILLERSSHDDLGEEGTFLDELREVIERLKLIDGLIVADISDRAPSNMKLLPLKNGGTLELKTGAARKKWQTEQLASVVAEKLVEQAVDKETGTIEVPTSVLMSRMLDYAGVGYWRVGKLKELGLDPNRYSESDYAKTTAIIRH